MVLTWESSLPTLLVVYQHADTKDGRDTAFKELKNMARLADMAFKPIEVGLYPMQIHSDGDTSLAQQWCDVDFYDVDVRIEGGDPFIEFDNLTQEQARKTFAELVHQFPQASHNDLRDFLT